MQLVVLKSWLGAVTDYTLDIEKSMNSINQHTQAMHYLYGDIL